MSRKTIEMKVDVEVKVVEEFCSVPLEYDVDSYAQELCDKWEKKEPNKEFTYYVEWDKVDDMNGDTICYIYENDRVHFHIN